jgi:hypothetical protein
LKKTHHKKRAGGEAQGVGPEFKLHYHKEGGGGGRGVSKVPVAHTSVILATWEAKIKRIGVLGQPGQIVCKTPSPK